MGLRDWSKFVVRVPVYTDVQKIYDLWATRAGLEKWFLRKAEFTKFNGALVNLQDYIQKGDKYEWLWHGWGDDVVERGTFLDANGKDFLKFIFGKAGVVSVQIKMEEGAAIVELVQEEIPDDEESKFSFHVGCSNGWTFYLANLKSVLEGGLDLRNKNINLQKVLNA